MPRHTGAYRGDKRRKEIARQKKQEEKRQRRISKGKDSENPAIEGTDQQMEETSVEDTDNVNTVTEEEQQQ